jgi:DNA mismatch repair protein MutL
VHPRKAEVRFLNEKEVFRAVMLSCEKALSKYVLSPNIRGENNEYDLRRHRTIMKIADAPLSAAEVKQPVLFSNINADNPPEYGFKNDDLQDFRESAARPREETAEIIPVAQIGNSYILCQQESNLVIVDQHAAHERIRYTEICEQFESRKKPVQPLLMPAQLELSHKDVAVLKDNMELLETMGFEIENFGGNTFSVLAVPSYISKENLEKVIAGLIDDLNDQAAKGDFQKRKERALTYMACRSAVKFGDKLSPEEQRALLKKLQTLEKPYTCPHGRPTMITLSFNELEKRFGRLNN